MKNLITLLIIIASLGCSNQKIENNDMVFWTSSDGTHYVSIDTNDYIIPFVCYEAKTDPRDWIPIDTVYGDTILTIDNSNYYKWYKVEYLGIGGPMVIHGTWINHKDSTITEFIITE